MTSSDAHDQPKRLGDFEILRELGRGGMGVVYEARQRSLNRHVALKVLSTGLGLTTKAVRRFKREAEAAAKLHHTNIVPIYSTGDEGRVPYYAMELVDGPSLDHVIRELRSGSDSASNGSLDSTNAASSEQQSAIPDWVSATIGFEKPSSGSEGKASSSANTDSSSSFGSGSTYFDNVASMMSGVADALAHAHDQGVIHRDIKPSNLLLSQDGRLSVNDFGLARMLEQPGMTVTGEFMGSPMYMSPEQITAGRIPLDHRTDIYSLGASLYQMLTLQTPFDGQQRDQVLSQIIHKEPARPRTVNNKVPKDLETICLKAMEKDPDRRYQTADQMAEDLRHFVDRHAISARRIGPVERAGRWARKNKALTAMACFTFIVAFSASVFVYKAWNDNRAMLREQAIQDALTSAMTGNLKEAVESIKTAKEYGATEEWALMLSGQVDLFRGDSAHAVEQLKSAVDLDRDNVLANSILAEAYNSDGQWSKYERLVDDLLAIPAKNTQDKLFKGYGIRWHSTEEGLRLMDEAIKDEPGFPLARVMRASARLFQALDRADQDLLRQAEKDLDIASEILENNALLGAYRLYARFAAYNFHRHENDIADAKEFLNQAEADIKQLEKHPRFLLGNYLRLQFYAYRSKLGETELSAMERVVEDVITHKHRGWVLDPYVTFLYRDRQNEKALKQLERMPDQDDPFLLVTQVFFLSEIDRQRAEAICAKMIEKNPQEDMSYGGLLLLGKRNEAVEKAKKYAPTMNVSTSRSFDRDKISYLGDLIEEKDLLERAGDSERNRGEAHFYIGLRKLAEGDREGGRERIKKSARSLVYHWTEIAWARAFAARMEKDPEWPVWLPTEPVEQAK